MLKVETAKSQLRFAEKVIKASNGEKGIVEPTYVYLPGVSGGDAIAKETGVDYFSVPVELGVSSEQVAPQRRLLTPYSHPGPRRLPISFRSSTTMRRSFSRHARLALKATSRRVSNSCTTHPQSDSPKCHSFPVSC